MNRLTIPSAIDTDVLERETGFGWGWFMVLGAALIVLGALALLSLAAAGSVSVYAVGIVMVIGAFAQLGNHASRPPMERDRSPRSQRGAVRHFRHSRDRQSNVCRYSAEFRSVLGLFLSGITRILLTLVMPPLPGRVWIAASGCVSVLTGLIFSQLSLGATVWLPGMALALDLTFQGAMAAAFGLALKASARAISSSTTEP